MNTIIPEYFAKLNKTRVFTPPDLLKYVKKEVALTYRPLNHVLTEAKSLV